MPSNPTPRLPLLPRSPETSKDTPTTTTTSTTTATPSSSSSTTPSSSSTLPNKWAIVIAASMVHALHATCVYMGPATLMSPMRQSLDLSIAQITQPLIAYRLIQAVFLIPAGYLLDAMGPQLSLRISITAAALLSPLLPLVTSLPQLILLQSLFSCTKLFGGLSAMLVIITQAFHDSNRLATATSLLLSGYSFAGFLAPAVIGALSETIGWRGAFACLSLVFILIALPLTFCFLRERQPKQFHPTSFFSTLSNRLGRRQQQQQHQRLLSPSRQQILRRANQEQMTQQQEKESLFSLGYITVIIAVATFSFSMHIVLDHLLVFLNEDFGLGFEIATMYISALNLMALFAKLAIGPIADRFNKSLLITIFGSVGGVASMLLLDFTGMTFGVTHNLTKIILFVALYAIGYASVFSLTTSVLPDFGRKKLGVRSNCNLMVLFAVGSLGSYAAGYVRSMLGSYKWPFMWNAIAWLFVAVCGLVKFVLHDRKHDPTAIVKISAPQFRPKVSGE